MISWLNYLHRNLPQKIKSKHYFDFAKIWPNSESPWIKTILANGTKSELQEMFYSANTQIQKKKTDKLRNSLSKEMVGDWLKKQNSMLARPLSYSSYENARKELFRLHLNPTYKEIGYGIFSRVQSLLAPISLGCIIFLFTILYYPMGFSDAFVNATPKYVVLSWLTLVVTLTNTFFSRKSFKRLIREADL